MGKVNEEIIKNVLYARMIMDQPTQNVALAQGISDNAVCNIVRIYKLVLAEDWDEICRIAQKNVSSIETVQTIAAGQGKTVPEFVVDAFKERNKLVMERVRSKKEAVQVVKMAESGIVEDNTCLYLIKILEALTAQNELLTQLCDIVIPHWTVDLKENQNANSDAIGQRMDTILQLVDGIKCNTRKRGT